MSSQQCTLDEANHAEQGGEQFSSGSMYEATEPCPCSQSPIALHEWHEYHKDASTSEYAGQNEDDRRVVRDAREPDKTKRTLHLCFLERAIATIDVHIDPRCPGPYFLSWRIVDAHGKLILEHPLFTHAKCEAADPSTRLQSGKQGWLWDGRDGAGTFVKSGAYFSLVTVQDEHGELMEPPGEGITLEGNPYDISIVGRPKSDKELIATLAEGKRFLTRTGERTGRDCWIAVYRGQGLPTPDEKHAVFLGQGTIEATKANGVVKKTGKEGFGAIATPHGVPYKGWVNPTPHKEKGNLEDRVQIESEGPHDQKIVLTNVGGPEPSNPWCEVKPGASAKDGVQAHGGKEETTNGMSVGCTTVCPMTGPSEWNNVRSLKSEFGTWGKTAEQDVTKKGPEFVNKQTKRQRTSDSLIADDHPVPDLCTEQDDADREPLHMQATMQAAVFGGFLGREIPVSAAVVDDPMNLLRIRMLLGQYEAESLYHEYHHAVVFGHGCKQEGSSFSLRVWIPRTVIRGWNGNRRNLLLDGNCHVSWYVEHKFAVPWRDASVALYPQKAVLGEYAPLQHKDLGLFPMRWNVSGTLPPGDYFSVVKYRVELLPFKKGTDEWQPEPGGDDLFSKVDLDSGEMSTKSLATMDEERLVKEKEGTRAYLEGKSKLLICSIPGTGPAP